MKGPRPRRGPQPLPGTLRGKLILRFLLISLLPLGVGGSFAYWTGKKTIEREITRDLINVTRGTRDAIKHFLDLRIELIRQIANRRVFYQISSSPTPGLRAEAQEHVERIKEEASSLLSLSVLDLKGKVFASTRRELVGQNASKLGRLPQIHADVSLSDVYRDEVSGRPAMRLMAPIVADREAAGEVAGAVVAELDVAPLLGIAGLQEGLGTTGEMVLINQERQFIIPPRARQDAFLTGPVEGWGLSEALAGREGTGIYRDYRGVKVLGAYLPLPEQRWALVAKMDAAEAFAPLRRMTWFFLALMAGAGMIVSFAAILVARRIADPISKVAQAAAGLGALLSPVAETRLPVQGIPRTGTEVDTLVAAFQEMTERLDQTAARLRGLHELSLTIGSTLDLQRVFDCAVEGIRGLLDVHLAHIWTLEATTGRLVLRATAGIQEPCEASASGLQVGEGLVGWIAKHRKPTRIPDLSADPGPAHREWVARLNLVSQMGVPVALPDGQARGERGAILGVLEVFSTVPREFRDDELDLLVTFAHQVAVAMENARLHQEVSARRGELELRVRELESFEEIARHLAQSLDLNEVLERIAREGVDLLRVTDCWVNLLSEDGKELRCLAAVGQQAPTFRQLHVSLDQPFLSVRAVRENRVIATADHDRDCVVEERHRKGAAMKAALHVPLQAEGGPVGTLSFAHTEEKRAFSESEIRLAQRLADQAGLAIQNARLFGEVSRAKAEWENTFDAAVDMIVILDPEYRIVRANQAAARRFGMAPGALIGRPCYEVFDGCDAPPPDCPHVRCLQTREPVTAERGLAHSGEFCLRTASPLFDDRGRLMGVVQISKDITTQKKLQQQVIRSERLAAMGRLVAGVAHEMNNPLTAVLGHAQLLRLEAKDEATRQHAEIISNEAERAARIVRSLLSFARPGKPEKRPVSLNPLIEETLALRADELSIRNIAVTRDLAADIPPVAGDRHQLQQVLLNLLVNAEQAIGRGRGYGEVRIASSADPPRAWARVTIEDNGPGIPPAFLDKIFDPFFTTREIGQGTGLGLSICHAVVSEHGGKIRAENRPEGGARLEVELPVAESPTPPRPCPPLP